MDLFQTQHQKFIQFLGSDVLQSKTTAREKLVKLSKSQFSELSTDVYDELLRREANLEPFLSVKDLYHPKRNQARQKLATLQLNRFKELCGDVMSEIERRYPTVKSSGINFQSLDNLVADLGAMVQESTVFGESKPVTDIYSKPVESNIFAKPESIKSNGSLKRDLPSSSFGSAVGAASGASSAELLQLREQIQNLTIRLKEKDQEVIGLLESQQKQKLDFDSRYRQLNDSHEIMKKKYTTLEQDYNDQKEILHGIRTEASNLLQEIKSLSHENQGLKDECHQYRTLVDDLKRETGSMERQRIDHQRQVDQLQSQIEQLKRQNREMQEKVIAKEPVVHSRTNPNIDFGRDRIHETSAFRLDRIKPYTMAVDQLLQETKSQKEPSTNVLVAMRSIVLACKTITEDCDSFESMNSLAPLDKESIGRLKQQLSSCLTKQMQIAKECATTASETSAKSMLDSTCALTSVVVDLITTVNRIVDQTLANQMVAPSPKSSYNLQELKVYHPNKTFLEQQTDSIVQAIQRLLEQLRLPKPTGDMDPIVAGISQIVSTIIQVSSQSFDASPEPLADDIIMQLSQANANLIQSTHDLQANMTVQSKQQVASHSYEIAKVIGFNVVCEAVDWVIRIKAQISIFGID